MYFLGIDLAKKTFDVTLLTPDCVPHHRTFPNTPTGFRALWRFLTAHKVSRATCLYGSDQCVLGSPRSVSG